MNNLDLSNRGVTTPELTRVRYLVKVKNENGEYAIHSFNDRLLALKSAFNVACVCRECKVYFVRCRTI